MSVVPESLKTAKGDALLDALIQTAIAQNISDIHFHPEKDTVHIQWRLLGLLQDLLAISRQEYEGLVRKIKFQAKLKLNLENQPQDGQFTVTVGEAKRIVNIRVASLPTRFGEAYTLRFLDPARGIKPLTQLGFPQETETELQRLVQLPNGLILVTGPTGSGKTTTLYALLETIAGKERNIITLEDPVEYELKNVVQSQIDPEHGYTFSAGLRAVLRHDPDVILVGEIRDLETAQTAIDASLTGHLVLATLHTNSAIEAIPRLLSMGVSSYTFAPALRGVLAQRLIRTVKEEYRAEPVNHRDAADFYAGQCVLSELLVSTPDIEAAILEQRTAAEILAAAQKSGFLLMRQHGEALVEEGKTTKEELARVTANA